MADCGSGVTYDRTYTDVDGLVTDEPQVILCTQYADCVPLLFADPVKRVVATAHSGWRDTVQRIGAVTVEKMCADYGCRREDIRAAIGPSIGPCCFEVDEPVMRIFADAFPDVEAITYRQATGKYHIDLWHIMSAQLMEAGIRPENITVTAECTCCGKGYFSFRRDGKLYGGTAGGGYVWLEGDAEALTVTLHGADGQTLDTLTLTSHVG